MDTTEVKTGVLRGVYLIWIQGKSSPAHLTMSVFTCELVFWLLSGSLSVPVMCFAHRNLSKSWSTTYNLIQASEQSKVVQNIKTKMHSADQSPGCCWIHIYVDIKASCKRTQWLRIPTCICGRVIRCRSAPGRYPGP